MWESLCLKILTILSLLSVMTGIVDGADCGSLNDRCVCVKGTGGGGRCVYDNSCIDYTTPCKDPELHQVEPRECAKYGSKFAYNGYLCDYPNLDKIKEDSCKLQLIIQSANLNGDHFQDEEGVQYRADNQVPYKDPDQIRHPREISADKKLTGVPEGEEALYRTGISGRGSGAPSGKCVTYDIDIDKNETGLYQIRIKTLEAFVLADRRFFTILFGDQPVVHDLDIAEWAGGFYKPLTIHANFQVKDETVVMRGGGSFKITDEKIPLSFCNHECETSDNRDFFVNAFAVVKFIDPPKERSSGKQGMQLYGENGKVNAYVTNMTKDLKCGSYEDLCKCQDDTKEYRQWQGSYKSWNNKYTPYKGGNDYFCENGQAVCKDHKDNCANLKFEKDECFVSKGVYAHAGTVCNSTEGEFAPKKYCKVDKIILAISFQRDFEENNVTDYQDGDMPYMSHHYVNLPVRLIYVSSIPQVKYEHQRPAQERELALFESSARSVTPMDVKYGYENDSLHNKCLAFAIPIEAPANYQLRYKVALPYDFHNRFVGHEWNVRLNGVTILQEFQLWHHITLNNVMTVFVNFRVKKDGDKMTMKLHGWDEVDINGEMVLFELCSGMCPVREEEGYESNFPQIARKHFSVAAFSFVKFKSYKS